MRLASEELHEKIGFDDKLEGWESLIHDKCLKNELMDVKTINIPDLSKSHADSEV